MSRVLLDTDIFSEVLKQRDANVLAAALAYRQAHGRFTISVITAMEITAGLHRIGATKQLERFDAMLAGCDVLDFEQTAALLAGRIEADLRRRGTPIDLGDVMIGAIAIDAEIPIVTGNVAHYDAIASAGYALRIENWRVR